MLLSILDDNDDTHSSFANAQSSRTILSVKEGIDPITLEEFVSEQAKYAFCCMKRTEMDREANSPFKLNEEGLIVRASPFDGAEQICVPRSLRARLLHNSHYPRSTGHPGGRRMYSTMRKHFYWPQMTSDVYANARRCDYCAKERIRQRKIASKLKLFPATAPLESAALDLRVPLPTSYRGNNYLPVVTDRYTKFTRAVPLQTPNANGCARAFCVHWAFVYGPPVMLLSDNGGHFAAKFFKAFFAQWEVRTCIQLRIIRVLMVKPKDLIELYDQHYDTTWMTTKEIGDEYANLLTFGYNTQAHTATGLMPFELVLSRVPKSPTMEKLSTIEGQSPKEFRSRFMKLLRQLFDTANTRTKKYQMEYKAQFNSRVRTWAMPPAGSYVYQRRHTTRSEDGEGKQKDNKLRCKVDGLGTH